MSSDDAFADEILEIFVEEVGEVLLQIDTNLPLWEANVNNGVALKEVRRAFHTLKGSGRMVQALDLGELAWSIESLLNRVIDGTLTVQPAIIEVVKETRSAVPAMLNAFRNKQAAALSGVNFTQLIDQANDLVAGKPVKPLRGNTVSQLSDEFLAQTQSALNTSPALDMVEIEALKERISELSVSIDEVKRSFVTLGTQFDAVSAQVKMMPKSIDPIAINKQLRNADQEIQELKYFIKASTEKMLADSMDQQRRLDAKVDRELKIITGVNEQVEENIRLMGEKLKADFANTVKLWAIGAGGVSIVFSIVLYTLLNG